MSRVLLLLFILVAFSMGSQTDTIFKKDKQVIVGRITVVNTNKIFYMDRDEIGRFVELNKVNFYSRNGIRIDPQKKSVTGLSNMVIDTVNVSDELFYMRNCLTKFHSEYTTGLSITLIGGALAGTSLLLQEDQTIRTALGIGGMVIMMVGIATTFDAHKWLHRAGLGVSGKGNGVEIRYRLK